MSKQMYNRLSRRGKRRAVVVAGLKALFDMAVVGSFFYGACWLAYQIECVCGVA